MPSSVPDDSTKVTITDRYDQCDVFRWHDDNEPGLKEFREAIYDRAMRYRFRPYADQRALTETLPLPLRVLAQTLGRLVHITPASYGSGVFCSQLVAMLYEQSGLPLFKDIPPQHVTPRRLASCQRLRKVTSIVAVPDPDAGQFHPSTLPASAAGLLETHAARGKAIVRGIDEDIAELTAALSLSRDDDAARVNLLYARANHFLEDNDLDGATALLMEAIRLRPREARLWSLWITAHVDVIADEHHAITVGLTRLKALDPAVGAEVSEWIKRVLAVDVAGHDVGT